ncbi:MAG: tubulin-like doman-containing protein, partial [Clostridia bacterium]
MRYFDTQATKVNKINAALLVIGLGGSGADALRSVKYEFMQRFNLENNTDHPPRTSYLLIDTDGGEIRRRYHGIALDENEEFVSINADVEHALAPGGASLPPSIKSWLDPQFYTDPDLRRHAAGEGAGTYRQLSRMMLFLKQNDVYTAIQTKLQTLSQQPATAPAGARRISVIIVCGLSGGTGSGTFLDIAYLVHKAADSANLQVEVELYAVMPDVTIAHHAAGDTNKANIYKANSYAAFKELDYWMDIDFRGAGVADRESVMLYPNNVSVHWNQSPFDDVTLLCASKTNGVHITNAYDLVLNTFAETMVFTMASEAAMTGGDVYSAQGGDNTTANDTYSYQSAKSNEYAYIEATPHPLPERYRYRAIGAYSNLSEQRDRICIEANLLFSDVKAFCTKPSNLPAMQGNAPDDFFQQFWSVVKASQVAHGVAVAYDLAMFKEMAPWDEISVRNMKTGQHADCYTEWKKNATSTTNNLVEGYFDADTNQTIPGYRQLFQQTFKEMSANYIRQHGPQAYQLILTEALNGFQK